MLQLVTREMTEATEMPDRRENSWSDPRVLIAMVQAMVGIASLFVAIIGLSVVLIGGIIVMQKSDATSEMSNAQLAQQMTIVSNKVDKISDVLAVSTQTTAKELAAVQSEQATLRRDLDREVSVRADGDKWLEARMVSGK